MKTEQEIRKFVMEWLWASSKRRTVNREWDQQYIGDTVDMIAQARAPLQAEIQEIVAVLQWLWEEDEMGYIVDANGAKECGQCKSTCTPNGDMRHEEHCLQGKIEPILRRHKPATGPTKGTAA